MKFIIFEKNKFLLPVKKWAHAKPQIYSSVNSFWGVPFMWVKSFPAFWQPFILDMLIHGILLPQLFWPTVRKKCSVYCFNYTVISNFFEDFKSFSWWLEQFFLTVGQNNLGNKIPLLHTWILNDSARFFSFAGFS